MTKLAARLQMLRSREEGAGMVEYALLVALIAIIALAGVRLLGTGLNTFFSNLSADL